MIALLFIFPVASATSIVLEDPDTNYNLSHGARYLVDETAALSLEHMLTVEQSRTIPLATDHLSLGYTEAAVWLMFDLQLPGNRAASETWVVEVDYPLLDEISLYSKDSSGIWLETHYGDRLQFDQRPIDHRTFALPIDVDASGTEFMVRIASSSSMQIRLNIRSESRFYSVAKRHEVLFGVIYGVMLLMALYNLFLFISVRDRGYLAYVFATLASTVFIMSLNGHAYQFLWPRFPGFANTILPLSSALWTFSTALFTQLFLSTRQYAPVLDRILMWIISASILAVLVSLFADYRIAIQFSTALGLVNGLVILVSGFVCWAGGFRAARFFALAWVLYQFGTAMLILSRFGVLPDNFATHNSATLGLLFEIVMLSFALSDKYRSMTEKLRNNAVELERQVRDRTADLNRANQELAKLSMEDDLTELANRRQYRQVLNEEWQQHEEHHLPMSVILCDVDEFKQYNDEFGHEAGDECLRNVAAVIDRLCSQQGYVAARIGGDEFAIVMPHSGVHRAEALAQQLLTHLRRLDLEHANGASGERISLSIGISSMVPDGDNSIRDLIRTADNALYRAKDRGRGCFVAAQSVQ